MRICLMMAAVFALSSAASAAEPDRPTAILVSPIHEAQIVRADDGKDHVEYELLVINVFPEAVTLSSVTVLDPAGKELMRIERDALTAATQTVFARTQTAVIPASAAVSVDVDLILPPDTAPERVTHRIAYTLKADSELLPGRRQRAAFWVRGYHERTNQIANHFSPTAILACGSSCSPSRAGNHAVNARRSCSTE
jgi:hypothetical protein